MRRSSALVAILLGLLPLPVLAAPQAASAKGNVVLYRCVGSQGAIALRDSPCPTDQRQQVITMQRPQDPPPSTHPAPAGKPEKAAAPEREVRVVIAQPPRPMYECTDPDGERYTSDIAEGRQRWVPVWAYGGYPGHQPHEPRPTSDAVAPLPVGRASGFISAGNPAAPPPHPPLAVRAGFPAGGYWQHDVCQALPQEDVCTRLSDRKYAILRAYGTVAPGERPALDREQRFLDARLSRDCSGW